jgi:hypothetical protein
MKATCEVYAGIASILFIFIGNAPFIFPLLYWQFLRLKYMVNGYTKLAFGQIRMSGDGLMASCPSVIGMVWEKIKSGCEYMAST